MLEIRAAVDFLSKSLIVRKTGLEKSLRLWAAAMKCAGAVEKKMF